MDKRQALKTLRAARDELERLFRQREDLEREIARTREAVISLGLMVEHDQTLSTAVYLPTSLTEACVNAILVSNKPIDAVSIRKHVERMGFDIKSSNPLASVYSVLKRLIQQKQLRAVYRVESDGTFRRLPAYFWSATDARMPKGWAVVTDEQLRDDLQTTLNKIGTEANEELQRITEKLTERGKKLKGAASKK